MNEDQMNTDDTTTTQESERSVLRLSDVVNQQSDSDVVRVVSVLPCESRALARRSMTSYVQGRLVLKRDGSRFTLEGDVDMSNLGSDHFQMIFEALSMAADSDDQFKHDFAVMLSEIEEQSADWPENAA